MLIYSMTVSADGFVEDRDGGIDWSAPDEELFGFHLARVAELGACLLGRRLYETMTVWETDPSLRETEAGAEFAEVWGALPKVVFTHRPLELAGRARLATAPLAVEIERVVGATEREVEIGGASLARAALELDLIDELRMFRAPVLLGGGTPYFPPLPSPRTLRLLESRTFGSAVVYERYAIARSGG